MQSANLTASLVRSFFHSVRVRLVILVLVAVLPGVALTTRLLLAHLELIETTEADRVLSLARKVSEEHEWIIGGARQLLTGLAQLRAVREFDPQACSDLFGRILEQSPLYLNLAVAEPNGDISCAAKQPQRPVNIAGNGYFQDVMQRRDFAISGYLTEPATGKPSIAIAYPAVDKSGAVRAVLFLALSLPRLNESLSGLQLPQNSEMILMDDKGTILGRCHDWENWVGKSARDLPVFKAVALHQGAGTVETTGLDGVTRLYTFGHLPSLGLPRDMYVTIGIPREVFYLGYTQALYRDLIFMGLVAILALAAVWVVGDRLVKRPLDRIVNATKKIRAGDLSVRVGISASQGELDQLAQAFDEMAEGLQRQQADVRRSQERVERHLRELTALREIDRVIVSTLDLRTMLDVLLEKFDLLLPYAAATIRLFGKEADQLKPVACRNLNEEEWKARIRHRASAMVIATRGPVVLRNVQTDPQTTEPEFFRKYGLVSYLGLPLIAKGKILGVIGFYTREEHDFGKEELDFLNTLATQAAIAIENAQLYEQTVNANKVKDEFLSVMSHELRTPLNVVIGYSGMLKDGLLGELTPRQQEALAKIINRANDQLLLVNNILFATVLETEGLKVDAHKVNVADVLNQLRSAYEAPIHKDITLSWDYPAELPVIETDSGKLGQILRNLIENAIKFTDKGSITISAAVVSASPVHPLTESGKRGIGEAERWVEFKVADTGVGIPQEALPYIFDKFRQVDSSETRRFGGAGLGLYIVKKFTELLGGTVEVESEVGKGSTFTVKLPLQP